SFNRALIFTFPAWTLLISVLIWKHSRNLAMARLSSTPAVQTGQALFASRSSSDETMGEGDA
ncbi:MAG: hypothetical protein IT335_02445, partial [Thermomicrobiales bacterium]|nr:hypothetical protein [Thermomicrobiales bacterium]